MAAYDDVDAKRIFTVGILSIAITAVTALAVQVVYYYMVQIQTAETAAASDYTRQNTILKQQQDEIATYGVDPITGNIVIPINKAIELMVDDKKTESPTSDSNDDGSNDDDSNTNEQEADAHEEA